jgi:hypothetical protein
LPDSQRQYLDNDQKAAEIWPVQAVLQPTIPISDRLLDMANPFLRHPHFPALASLPRRYAMRGIACIE